jgi:hypothetical protein
VKDFPFWRGAIYNAKTTLELRIVIGEIAKVLSGQDFPGKESKFTAEQVDMLRKMYSEKLEELEKKH